jgi:hypothetical protein
LGWRVLASIRHSAESLLLFETVRGTLRLELAVHMSQDRVTIDPEFRSSPPNRDDDRSRQLRRLGVVTAVLGATLVWGWLLLSSPSSPEPELDEAASTSLAPPVTATSLAATPLDVPLREAVPGFRDVITAMTWGDHGVDILRWPASETAPELTATFGHGTSGRNRGLDATGRWHSEIREQGVLTVQSVAGDTGERSSRVVFGELVRSSAWHDTEPGRLAWLACSPDSAATSGTLYEVDASRDVAESVVMRSVENTCRDGGAWLAGWGEWGMLFEVSDRGRGVGQVLVDPLGIEIARGSDASGDAWMIAGGPDGSTIWTVDPLSPAASSFRLSADGRQRSRLPGLADDEWLDAARWSPDGSLLALLPRRTFVDDPVVRVVEVASGAVVAEVTEPGWEVWATAWSTDGRFFLYQRWPDTPSNWAAVPRGVELVIFDTIDGDRIALRLPQYAAVIRASDQISAAS